MKLTPHKARSEFNPQAFQPQLSPTSHVNFDDLFKRVFTPSTVTNVLNPTDEPMNPTDEPMNANSLEGDLPGADVIMTGFDASVFPDGMVLPNGMDEAVSALGDDDSGGRSNRTSNDDPYGQEVHFRDDRPNR